MLGSNIFSAFGLSFDSYNNSHDYNYERLYMKNPETDEWENKINVE